MFKPIAFCLFFSLFCFIFSLEATYDIASVPFRESMKRSNDFKKKDLKDKHNWALLEDLYKFYSVKPRQQSTQYLIPKIIHFIWLGSPLPERCKPMVQSWKKYHPSWQVRVWTDADVASFKMKNKPAFDKAINYGEKSDIWRYEILERFGGLYVDTDFECVKPFDPIHQSCKFYTGVAYGKVAGLYNGLIGTIPNHPIIKRCVESVKTSARNNDHNRILKETGPWLLTRAFLELAGHFPGDVVAFPITFFYSFPCYRRFDTKNHNEIKKRWLEKESYALHYWAASWTK